MYGCSRDCEENDWEVLPHPHQEFSNGAIPAEDGHCCLGGLGIDPEGLIMVNYFACPSAGRDKYDDHADEFRMSFAVQGSPVGCLEDHAPDDGLRFGNCSDSESPSCSYPEETEEQQGVPGTLDAVAKADGFIIGVDDMECEMTDGLCIRPPLSYTLAILDPSLCTLFDGGTEGAWRGLWREEKEPTEGSEFASELQIIEKQDTKLAEKSDVDVGADDRLEDPQSCCVMDCKCKAWWKRPLGILGSRARQIWSLGMTAAVMGSVILGRRWYRGKHQNHNHTLRFQIYAHDKRISQLMCQAARLNEAFSAARGASVVRAQRISQLMCQAACFNEASSAARGASVVRAQISFGDYHDGLQRLTSKDSLFFCYSILVCKFPVSSASLSYEFYTCYVYLKKRKPLETRVPELFEVSSV